MQNARKVPHWNPSGWLDNWERTRPSLSGDIETDIAVIGGGFTGLSTARAMRERGREVVVLEAEHVGFGASGRNAGGVSHVIGGSYVRMIREPNGKAMFSVMDAAVANVDHLVREHNIDCDYKPVGSCIAAVHKSQFNILKQCACAYDRLGIEYRFLKGDAVIEFGLPPAFQQIVYTPKAAQLNPGKLVTELGKVTEKLGATIFEGTPVDGIEEGPALILHTPHGRVRANHVVIATNGFPQRFSLLDRRVRLVHVSQVLTDQLSEEQLTTLQWRHEAAAISPHKTMEAFRLTADRRVLLSTKRIRFSYDNCYLEEDAKVFGILERTLRKRFPSLRDIGISSRWSGPVGLTMDFLPIIERVGKDGRMVFCGGYCGEGVPLSNYSGYLVADMIDGRNDTNCFHRRVKKFPPEPFGYIAARSALGVLDWLDDRLDAKL